MNEVHFNFELSPNGQDCRIWKNGVEISHELSGFAVVARVGERTQVILEYPYVSGEGTATVGVSLG